MKELKLEIEVLEERIAPSIFAPGLNAGAIDGGTGPGADVPPGQSGPNHSPVATTLWFGRASGQDFKAL